MPRGRKPKPTALKKLSGTAQPCRVNKKDLSSPAMSKAPSPPKWFTPLAKKIYKDTTRQLTASRVLTAVDLQMLISYCQELSNYLEIMERFNRGEEDQVITVSTKQGQIQQVNPLFKIAQASLEKAKSIGVEFGLTPSSRAKVHPIQQDQQDDFESFMQQR